MAASDKPGKGNRIFVSTVSGEFEKAEAAFPGLRSQLRRYLTAADCEVKVQEDFRQTSGGTLEKLDEYIRHCDAVIHLVGKMPGHPADADSPQDVVDYLKHIAAQPGGRSFLDQQPELLAAFGDGSGISLTQFEAYMALHHVVPLFVYATPDARSGQQPHLDRLLKGRPRKFASPFKDAAELLGQLIGDLRDIIPTLSRQQPLQRIAPTRLISRHATDQLLGREAELALLDKAWSGSQTINLLSIIAWGGVGKTALLAYWVRDRFIKKSWLDEHGQPDPMAYFDWTFYDQGTRSDDATHAGAASVGSFWENALHHFGDAAPQNPQNRASRLAKLIQAQRSLLILDGLEPLQYPFHHPQAGLLTDPELRELLGLLAQRNPGLCLVSSRQPLSDFLSGNETPTRQHDLGELPLACAVSLLRKMQIIGTEEELKEAAEDYFCHALSLIVLGRFLFVKGGDIRIRKQIPLERANDNRKQTTTRNAWHVLEAYEEWLASAAGNAADVQALRLIGLFDRPASADCLAALRKAPAIPGLTEHLVPLDDDAWNATLLRLDEAHLLQLRFPSMGPGSFAPRPEARHVPVDAHPLIREYFAKQLREKQPAAFQSAHSRLFDHLCVTTKPLRPATLEGLQPLYQAVVHGCLAGRQPEALEKVYDDRILRGTGHDGFFSKRQLGAIGADLGAVAAFFEQPWSRLSDNLNAADKAWLLIESSVRLRALGRLTEAVEPLRVGIGMYVEAEDWINAAICAQAIGTVEVTMGRIQQAVAGVHQSIDYAGQSGDAFQQMEAHATAADVMLHYGDRDKASHFFDMADIFQREVSSQFNMVITVGGFAYCDLNLANAEQVAWQKIAETFTVSDVTLAGNAEKCSQVDKLTNSALGSLAEAERRAKQMQEWTQHYTFNLNNIALNHLTLARVAIYRAILQPSQPSGLPTAECQLALDGLRKSGHMDDLPRALLTAALHHHLCGEADAASRALAEAQQIAERGPMPLFLADVHLHRARLFRDKSALAQARTLIHQYHYGRRTEELADAEAAATQW